MNRSLRRALTTLAAMPLVAGALLSAAPAATATHDVMPACDPNASTRLFTGTVLGWAEYLWIHPVSANETRICFGEYPDRLAMVLNTGVSITTPAVVQTPGFGNCASEVFDIQDPVDVQFSYGFTTAPTFCWGVNEATTTITVTGVAINSIPSVQVWRAPYGWLAFAHCSPYYASYLAGGSYYTWDNCYGYARRIL